MTTLTKDIIRMELAIPSVIVNDNMVVTALLRVDGREIELEEINEVAKKQDISIKQMLLCLMSESHSLNFFRENKLSIHYLDTLSAAGRAARYDVDVRNDEGKLVTSLIGEHVTSIMMRYDTLLVRVNDGNIS